MFSAVLLYGIWHFWPTEPAAARPSLAVLPFDNLDGDEASGRLADGVTEDIITDLARFRDLDVIARNSAAIYKGRPIDLRQVGRDLDVRYVIEGSLRRQDGRVRLAHLGLLVRPVLRVLGSCRSRTAVRVGRPPRRLPPPKWRFRALSRGQKRRSSA